MDKKYLKNVDVETVLNLKDLVSYQQGQIVSKTLAQTQAVILTLFAFDKSESISTHESDGDALVIALDGEGEITIADKKYRLKMGDSIVMPARKPHAVYATEQFKMFLIVVFPI